MISHATYGIRSVLTLFLIFDGIYPKESPKKKRNPVTVKKYDIAKTPIWLNAMETWSFSHKSTIPPPALEEAVAPQ